MRDRPIHERGHRRSAGGRRRPWRDARIVVGACLAIACVVGLVLGVSSPSAAEGQPFKSWTIDSIDVVAEVQENGDVVAEETYAYTFVGSFSWVTRDISLMNMDKIDDIEVRDANGNPLPRSNSGAPGTFSTWEESGTQHIQVNFDITDASAAFTFHYLARSMVSFGEEDDALEWYVFDAEIGVPVGGASVTVKLPGSVPEEQLLHNVDVGYSVQASVHSPGPSTLVFEATDIPAYTRFWTKTGFPKGVVKDFVTARDVIGYIVPKLGFVLPVITFLAMLLIWMRRGRDQPGQVYAKYVSELPSDMPPGLVGALIDEKVDTKEVMATIVDLARRGYLEMTEGSGQGKSRKTGTIFTRLKPFDDLLGFEKLVAESLFDSTHPDEVTTAHLKNRFYKHIPQIANQVYEDVTSAGLFHKNPKKTRSGWAGRGFLVGGLLALLTVLAWIFGVGGYGWLAAGSVISVVIIWLFAPHMPGRTPKGAQEQKKWEAFRNYLRDLARFQDMEAAKEKYELCLPYAVALGVEKDWTRRFEDLTVPSPDWYHPPVVLDDGDAGPVRPGGLGGGGGLPRPSGGGGRGFSLDDVSDGLFNALGKVSNALTSAPSSSSGGSSRGAWSSGGFGGGFSGGGFGGGGFSGGGGGGGGMRAG